MKPLTPWQLKWYPLAALMMLSLVYLLLVLMADGGQTINGKLGGDFFAFYGAGSILLEGDAELLYNLQRQFESQKDLLVNPETYLCFAYPPFVALPYAALAIFPYKVAYVVHTILMLLALFVALKILFDLYAINKQYFLPAFTLALFFYPVFRATFGGQNTLLTLLLLCLVLRHVYKNQHARTGLYIGLLLFKPQFALPVIGLMLLARRWTVILVTAVVGAFLYFLGALVLGAKWLTEWLDFALWFSQLDASVNSINAISWTGFLVGMFGSKAFYGGILMSLAHAIVLSYLWFRNGPRRTVSGLMPLTVISLILIPVHVMYYDAGLLIIACVAFAAFKKSGSLAMLAVVWLGAFLQIAAPYIGFSPLFFLVVGCLVMTLIFSWQGDGKRFSLAD